MQVYIRSNFTRELEVFVLHPDEVVVAFNFPQDSSLEELHDKIVSSMLDNRIDSLTLEGHSSILKDIEEYFERKGVNVLWR